MSDDNFDITKIKYANSKSKITLDSKKILDDLANKVKQWNEEDLEYIKNPALKANIEHKKKFQPTQFKSPPKNRRLTLKDSEFRNSISGSVKKRIAEIESRKTESPININLPKRKIIYPSFLVQDNAKPDLLLPPINQSKIPIFTQVYQDRNNNTHNDDKMVVELNSLESLKTDDFKLPAYPLDHPDLTVSNNQDNNLKESIKQEISILEPENLDLSITEFSKLEFTNLDNDSENDKENIKPSIIKKNENKSISRISESFTDISLLNDSNDEIGLLKEFEMECMKMSQASQFSSIIKRKSSDRPRPRRSLSFNDKVEVFEPSPDEYSDTSQNLENPIPIFEPTRASTFLKRKSSSDMDLRPIYVDHSEILQRELKARECMQFKIDMLQKQLRDSKVRLGGEEHVKTCADVVKTKLLMNTLALEKANLNIKSSIIEGDLEIKELILGFKPNFVIVASNHPNLLRYWNKIRSIKHLLICVYVEDRSNIFTSEVFTLIEVTDAEKYSVEFNHPNENPIIDTVHLSGIQPKSRLVFDVFCLNIQPDPKSKKCPSTPIKKFFARCGSVDRVNTVSTQKLGNSNHAINDILNSTKLNVNDNNSQPRSLVFTNIMTFEMSLCGIQESFVTFSDQLNVTKQSLLTGEVFFQAKMNLKMNKTIEGKLNVYSDVYGGMGNWTWYNCQVTPNGIEGVPCGGSSIIVNDPNMHVFIPWSWCNSLATCCPSWVCPKPRTMSVEITNGYESTEKSNNHTPINRRTSTDGKLKRRFLFEAASDEEQRQWCEIINEALTAYHSFRE